MTKHENNWDNRFDEERYFYGTEPNYFVARQLASLAPGRALFLAEGEGRNAVFGARLGHDVVAVDSSRVGRRKALSLATRTGVALDYRLGDIVGGDWRAESWDLIVLCFTHLPPEVMGQVHSDCALALAPAGTLVLNSFAKAQFGRKSGGPPRLEWLHDVEELRRQFPGLNVEAVETEVELDEAVGHRGLAMVVELVGRKPAA
jgi:SAM-dependent methyltransferase